MVFGVVFMGFFRSKNKEIELRKRTEDMLKFWSQYTLFLGIGFLGVHYIIPDSRKLISSFSITITFLLSVLLFIVYNKYHQKTTNIIIK